MKGQAHHAFARNGVAYAYGRIDGKTYRVSAGLEATKQNLAYVAREWRTIIEDKLTPKKSKGDTTVEAFGWRSLKAGEATRSQSTRDDYAAGFRRDIIPFFGARQIGDITALELKEWQNSMIKDDGAGTGRAKTARKIFRGIMNDAMLAGIVDKNPFALVKAPKSNAKEKRPLSLNEVRAMLKATSGWFHEFLALAFFTGARTGEILALKWEYVNFASQKIHIAKTQTKGRYGKVKTVSSDRVIDMLPPVEAALRRQYLNTGAKGEFVFESARKDAFADANSLHPIWTETLKRCEIDYRELYATRHTFASIMLSRGEDLLWTSKMLGHKNAAITLEYYAKYIPQDKVQRAEFLNELANDADKSGVCTQFTQKLHTANNVGAA
jgi:integrase